MAKCSLGLCHSLLDIGYSLSPAAPQKHAAIITAAKVIIVRASLPPEAQGAIDFVCVPFQGLLYGMTVPEGRKMAGSHATSREQAARRHLRALAEEIGPRVG